MLGERAAQHKGSILASHPTAPGSIPSLSKKIKGKIIHAAEVNQRRCLEESEQWLVNGDRTHLVMASGKPVLQKEESSEYEQSKSVETKWESLRLLTLRGVCIFSQYFENSCSLL